MIINWYGEGCFKIQTGGITLLVDSFENDSGLTPPRFKTDIRLSTKTSLPFSKEASDLHHIVGPGEYEISGIDIIGASILNTASEMTTAYRIVAEGIRLGFLGYLTAVPSDLVIERLGDIDVLFLPAGGAPYIDLPKAVTIIKQIAPKIIVPSFFNIPELKRKAGSVDAFLKELGQTATPQEKLTIKKKDIPEKTTVTVLTV